MIQKIGFKLIATVGIPAIVIIGVFAWVNLKYQSDVLLVETERHISQNSETIKNSTRFDMMGNRRLHIHNIIHTIGSQSSIKSVRIFNKEGRVIYAADTTLIGTMVDKAAEACYSCHTSDQPLQRLSISERARIFQMHPDSSRVMGFINPIYNEPGCSEGPCHAHSEKQTVLGVLDVTICLEPIDKEMAASRTRLILFAIIAIGAVSIVLFFFVRKWVDKPVNELVNATKIVASGDFNYSIEHMGEDELGTLARSFNHMTQKLSEARMQLFQSDKMASLGRLAAGVAHEINNPLTGILTYSSYLLKRLNDQPEFRDDMEVIVRETKRSREIVKGLLDFARQSIPKKNKADINEIVDKTITIIENQLTIYQIKLVKNLELELPLVTLDGNQMQQVFTNLLINAVHAIGKKGGTITLSTSLITLAPFGMIHIKNALCPKGHNLMNEEAKIDGLASIEVFAQLNGNEGIIHLDPIYGKNRNKYGLQLDEGVHIDLSCPKCKISLVEKGNHCKKCGAPIFNFEIPGKGTFEGCVRVGCNWQYWKAVELEGKRDYIEIRIIDTGCGIPKESLDKIFEPFYTTKGQKGTGLGLAVIWGIMEKHEGTISVDSTLGKGTTFTLRIPVV